MPRPPARVTPSAVANTVPGSGASPSCWERPVTYTVAPSAPSASAMPLPAPREAPGTRAITPSRFLVIDESSCLAQLELHHLSRRRHRQGLIHLHVARHLVIRHLLAAPGDEGLVLELGTWPQHDASL